jgi:hypothetical protein
MDPMDFQLHRDPFGRLVLTDAQGLAHVGVTPVRAFPLAAPDEGLSLVGPDGHELVWLDHLAQLPVSARSLLEEDLAARDFAPAIERIVAVSSFSTPCTWQVLTDRGAMSFVLKSEDDIRRLAGSALLIASGEGLQLRVADHKSLDRPSRKLLERFL